MLRSLEALRLLTEELVVKVRADLVADLGPAKGRKRRVSRILQKPGSNVRVRDPD